MARFGSISSFTSIDAYFEIVETHKSPDKDGKVWEYKLNLQHLLTEAEANAICESLIRILDDPSSPRTWKVVPRGYLLKN